MKEGSASTPLSEERTATEPRPQCSAPVRKDIMTKREHRTKEHVPSDSDFKISERPKRSGSVCLSGEQPRKGQNH